LANTGESLDPAAFGFPAVDGGFQVNYSFPMAALAGLLVQTDSLYNVDRNGTVFPQGELVPRHFKSWELEWYVQDSWRIKPNFTLTLCLRHSLLQPPYETAGNQVVHNAVMESRQSIAGGETIAAPLEKSKVFPPMVISMIAVGEQTGGLDEMLSKIADFYDEEVDVAVSALLSLMEPAMIVILGVIVGGMVIAMYLPIFDMMNAVQ
jgi:hypothetical protein